MLPIILDPSALRAGVAGAGEGLSRRLALLAEAGVTPGLIAKDRGPSTDELETIQILFVAGLDEGASARAAQSARAAGVLVNVEDRPALCDFHVPAQIRRGDLLLTVSTGGRSPGLARALREDLERRFGADWDGKLEEIAHLRASWRSQGIAPGLVSERTRHFLNEKGWLS